MQFNRRHGLSSATRVTPTSSPSNTPTHENHNDDANTSSQQTPMQEQRSHSPFPTKASKIPIPNSVQELRPFPNAPNPVIVSAQGFPKLTSRLNSKPPLPPTSAVFHSRPPTRLSSKNGWATGERSNNNNFDSARPISPITRGNKSSPPFQYKGPHQVYSGPIENSKKNAENHDCYHQHHQASAHAEGPENLHYSHSVIPSGTSSTSQEYHRTLCEQISGFPLKSRRKSRRRRSRANMIICDRCKRVSKSQEDFRPSSSIVDPPELPVPCLNNCNPCTPCAFRSFVEKSRTELAAGEASINDDGDDGINRNNKNQSTSKSAPTIPDGAHQQQEHSVPFPMPRSSASLPPRGPFPKGVPTEIHDDLIRIEMLMELRKYKQALKTQIQAQERMLHMVDGYTSPSSLPQIPQNLYPFIGLGNRAMDQQDPFQIFSVNPPEGPTNLDSLGVGGSPSPTREDQVGRPVTVWENVLGKHLDSYDFYAPILEPHSQPLINNNSKSGGGGINSRTRDGQIEQEEDKIAHQLPQDFINQAMFEIEQNHSPRVSLLKGTISPDGYQPSVFPSELMSGLQARQQQSQFPPQNPLLAGAASLDMHVPNYQQNENIMPGGNYSRKTFVPLDPVSIPAPFSQQNYDEGLQGQAQQRNFQQYQQFLLDKNPFLDRHHNIPTLFHQQQHHQEQNMHFWDAGQMIMLRKPVAISKNRSPVNYFSASPATPQSTSTTFGSGNEDRPSPFFPGVSTSRMDIKIRSPEERLSHRMMEEVNPKDVEKLGNILSQLPVLSQQQKVEEFTFSTLKPPSPVTEAESNTSMLPLVSSNGTLTSRVASSGDDRPRTGASAIVEAPPTTAKSRTRDISTVDTDKMSIHELVTLGRKIYRILSQLSTHAPNKSTPTTPTFAINPYAPHPPRSFILNQTSSMRGHSKSTTSAIVDFSIIPNPTFITGPGATAKATQSKSSPGVTDSATKPPHLFRKFHQPPPTRWEKRSNSAHPPDLQRQNISQSTVTREISRRSVSTVASKTPNRTPTRTILKWEAATVTDRQSPKSSGSYTIKSYNDNNFNNGNNNQTSHKNSKSQQREGDNNTSYSFPPVTFQDQIPPKSNRGSSVGKRNFIKENISKIRRIKPTSKTRAPPLPPVTRKYDNVPSVIGSSSRARTDRSSSLPRDESTSRNQRDRSTSIFPTPSLQKREYLETNNTFRNNPLSRRPSVPSNSSRAQTPVIPNQTKSRESMKMKRQARSRNTLPKGTNNNIEESKMGLISKTKLGGGGQRSRSAFFSSKAATVGMITVSKTSVNRKSRSKTRRASAAYKQQMEQIRQSSVSSAERNPNPKLKGRLTISNKSGGGGFKKKKSERSTSSNWASQRVAPLPEIHLKSNNYVDTDDHEPEVDGDNGEFVTSSLSEQAVIRQMVKAEMDMMVERHVKDVMLRTNEEKDVDYRSARHKQLLESEPEDSILDSENLEPVYTPPRFQDTSLFSLEQWINPEGNEPGTAYTSAKDTPATTAEDGRGGGRKNGRAPTKPQTVRFSLPQYK
ncbi:unnamed protein product [Orchesella dallaii]|uniref:Uncharacterized protein n=1 Tax=Orchesella dallaii TaxID=48710 RepID=A0ABP1Q6P3_9HEXA